MRVNKMLLMSTLFLANFFFVNFAQALVISEIQYDPSGSDTDREWLEVFNETISTIKLTDYKFFENNTNHGIVKTTDDNINSGEYIIIAQDVNKFKIDNPGYTGKIFTSSFSLSNTGESLSLKDGSLNIVNTVNYANYLSGTGNGLTVNFNGTSYFGAAASPGTGTLQVGYITQVGTSTPVSTSTATQTISTTTATTSDYFFPTYFSRSYYPESEKIYVNAGKNLVAITGQELTFSVTAKTGENRDLFSPNFFWSFGDGTSAEGKNVKHDFKMSGEYVVVVEVYSNGNKETDRIYVKVLDPDIKISTTIKNNSKVLSILNNSNFEINLGNIMVTSNQSSNSPKYVLPRNFSILGSRVVDIPFSTLKFATSTSMVSLNFENGSKLAEYFEATTSTLSVNIATPSAATTTPLVVKKIKKIVFTKPFSKTLPIISGSTSEVANNSFVIKTETSKFSNFLQFLGL